MVHVLANFMILELRRGIGKEVFKIKLSENVIAVIMLSICVVMFFVNPDISLLI